MTEPPSPTTPKALLREVLLACAGVTGACALLSVLQDFVPLLRANLYVLVAAIFLYLPVLLLRRRGLTTLDVGLTTRPRTRGLLFAAGAMLLVFPPFLLGFHLWQGWVFGNRPHFDADAYHRWPMAWEGRPGERSSHECLELYVDFSELRLRWQGLDADHLDVLLGTDGKVELLSTRGLQGLTQGPGSLSFSTHGDGELRFRVRGGRQLSLSPTLRGQALDPQQIRLGAGGVHPDELPLKGERGLSWIFFLVLSHLLLVALPEELFYRGYVQTTLDHVWPRRWKVLGVEIGMSVLVVSIMFALGHFLVDLRVQRLAVFFPSLLFCWLRAGTDSLMAPVLFHAASNIFSDMLTKGYVQ